MSCAKAFSVLALGLAGAPAAASPLAEACARLAGPGVTISADATACRVTGVLHPVPSSRIGFALWLPTAKGWSGRLVMLGNGGYSSRLPREAMAAELARGSAVVATDTGHDGDGPEFARGRPEAIVDWGWRAVHLSAVAARRLATRFYGRKPKYRYFNGCSTGGHQALMEAQRFPQDFDGIVAGAPGAARVRLNSGFLWQYLSNHLRGDDLHPILDSADLALLQRSSVAVCRRANGNVSGGLTGDLWLNDPMRCRFDPGVLACRPGATSGSCLTSGKIAAARAMYAGATNPRTGVRATTPWLPGSEAGWSAYLSDADRPTQPARTDFWRIWAFDDPEWSPWRFDFGHDLATAYWRLSPSIDATSSDLSAFRAAGGKLLQYHGLADPVVSPLDSITYRNAVAARGPTTGWYRLFLAPGMAHCGGGSGFSRFDAQAAIEHWVEAGRAPDRLIARRTDPNEIAERPLCPYPKRAVFTGGDPTTERSFACRALPMETTG